MRRVTLGEFRELSGTELGTSAWHRITQDHIRAFATATDDYEPIHLDPVRAAETPLGVPIAHGLYTLSLGPKFLYEILQVTGHSLALNYGFDRVRFLSPVRVDSRMRMTLHLRDVTPLPGGSKFHVQQNFEVEGATGPACVADSVLAYLD